MIVLILSGKLISLRENPTMYSWPIEIAEFPPWDDVPHHGLYGELLNHEQLQYNFWFRYVVIAWIIIPPSNWWM